MKYTCEQMLSRLESEREVIEATGTHENGYFCFVKNRDVIIIHSFREALHPEDGAAWREYAKEIKMVRGSKYYIHGYWFDDVKYFLQQRIGVFA
jgi:hypothetical protein